MKILIAEDSPNLRESIKTGLVKQNFVVDAVCNGRQAIAYLSSYRYDVVLLDIMMPELDGFEVLQHIRDNRVKCSVIMLTALDQVDERVKGLENGADDYICKPFAFRELVARIKTVSQRDLNLNQFKKMFGNLLIDIGLQDVSVRDVSVNLTPTEYSLVECLALKAGTVVSFETLEDLLSNSDRYMTRNSMEVTIFNIRRKLKNFGEKSFIKNKRGIGYFIEQ